MSETIERATAAWGQRYKHGAAAREWKAIAGENPKRKEVSEILARWMYAYEEADAAAEKAFQDLAAREAAADGT